MASLPSLPRTPPVSALKVLWSGKPLHPNTVWRALIPQLPACHMLGRADSGAQAGTDSLEIPRAKMTRPKGHPVPF